MTIDLLKQFETSPAAYPAAPTGLTELAASLDADVIWARIETYIAFRFSEREVVWTLAADAGSEFNPRLAPMLSYVAHRWDGAIWQPVTLSDGPLGICFPSSGTYRIIAQVGGGEVPAPVAEAFRRLAEYTVPGQDDNLLTGRPGASSHTGELDGVSETIERNPAWLAKAMQWSGAADLLRNYRRAP